MTTVTCRRLIFQLCLLSCCVATVFKPATCIDLKEEWKSLEQYFPELIHKSLPRQASSYESKINNIWSVVQGDPSKSQCVAAGADVEDNVEADVYVVPNSSHNCSPTVTYLTQKGLPKLLDSLKSKTPGVSRRVGFGQYSDYPSRTTHNDSRAFIHRVSLTDQMDALTKKLQSLETINGGDQPDSAFTALFGAATSTKVGWIRATNGGASSRTTGESTAFSTPLEENVCHQRPRVKVVVLLTDTESLLPGSVKNVKPFPIPFPEGANFHDYDVPAAETVADALRAQRIRLILMVAGKGRISKHGKENLIIENFWKRILVLFESRGVPTKLFRFKLDFAEAAVNDIEKQVKQWLCAEGNRCHRMATGVPAVPMVVPSEPPKNLAQHCAEGSGNRFKRLVHLQVLFPSVASSKYRGAIKDWIQSIGSSNVLRKGFERHLITAVPVMVGSSMNQCVDEKRVVQEYLEWHTLVSSVEAQLKTSSNTVNVLPVITALGVAQGEVRRRNSSAKDARHRFIVLVTDSEPYWTGRTDIGDVMGVSRVNTCTSRIPDGITLDLMLRNDKQYVVVFVPTELVSAWKRFTGPMGDRVMIYGLDKDNKEQATSTIAEVIDKSMCFMQYRDLLESEMPQTATAKTTTPELTPAKPAMEKAVMAELTTAKDTTVELTTAKATTAEASTTKATTAEASTTKATTAEASTTKATTVEPTTAEPTTAEPTTAEPTTAEPTTAEPTTAEPTTAEPTTAEPTTAEPTTAEPTTAEPTTAEPTTIEPTKAEPTTVEPTTAKPMTPVPTPSTQGSRRRSRKTRDIVTAAATRMPEQMVSTFSTVETSTTSTPEDSMSVGGVVGIASAGSAAAVLGVGGAALFYKLLKQSGPVDLADAFENEEEDVLPSNGTDSLVDVLADPQDNDYVF